MSSILFIFSVVLLVLAYVYVMPFSIYCGYQLFANWNEPFISVEDGHLFSSYSTVIFTQHFIFSLPHSYIVPIFSISHAIHAALPLLYLVRVYLLYFDHEYNRVLNTQKWQIFLDPTLQHTNWFIVNRNHKFGDEKYLLMRILLPVLLLSISSSFTCSRMLIQGYNQLWFRCPSSL